MDGFNQRIVAGVLQGFFNQEVKGFLLVLSCHGHSAAGEGFDEAFVEIFRIFGVVEEAVDICAAVIERGEKEASVGHFHQPVSGTVAEAVLLVIIGKTSLGKLDRADRTENVVVNLIGGVKHLQVVRGFSGDVIEGVD